MSHITRRRSVWWLLGGTVVVCYVSLMAASIAVGQSSVAGTGSAISTTALATDSGLTTSMLRMLGALCFCLGVLAVGVRVVRRFAGPTTFNKLRRIEVRERTALSSKAALFLVAVDNREYLIASCSNSISVTPTHSITTQLFAESLDEVCQESGGLHA